MGSLPGPVTLGILVLFITTHTATASRQCKIGCNGSPGSLFKYELGTNYKYKLEGTSLTKIGGSQEDVAKLGLSAHADVSALPNCVFALKLSNVQLTGQDGKTYADPKELESKPIRFSLNNGKVESELCTAGDESMTALNIKRAVVSLLQSTFNKDATSTTQYETDIFGSCPTLVEVSQGAGGVTLVRRNRDLNACAHREGLNLPFLGTPYFTKSAIQNSPLFASANQNVEQEVEGGVLKRAVSEEHYLYKPVAGAGSGTSVTVKAKLTLLSQAKGSPVPAVGSDAKSIIFEAPHEADGLGNAKSIVENLKKACDGADPVVTEDSAQDFYRLVKALSQASKADILTVYQQVKSGAGFKNKEVAKKMLLDGLVRAESGSSVEVMAELLKNKEVTGLKANVWLLSFGVVKHATRASLTAVLPLLDGEPSTEAYLGLGALAGKFCTAHPCVGVPEVAQLEAKLAAPLVGGCRPSSLDAEDHLIASLKGLSNIRYLSPNVVSKLCECASDKGARSRVRVAALETIRSDAKKDQFVKTASTILKNLEEDSEVRIKAYLVLAEAPGDNTAAVIKQVLDHEKINQVGSFIVSHLRNIRASTNPDKADAQHYFSGIVTPHKFPFDPRKFSQNVELSYSLDSVNVGTAGEANVIYSQKSFIPRSASLNLTTQLFGHAFNLLELDVRAENVEHVLEGLLGPKGKLSHDKMQGTYEAVLAKLKQIVNEKLPKKRDELVRPKRDTRAQLQALENAVVMSNEVRDEILDLDASLRLCGYEVAWLNYHSTDSAKVSADSVLDQVFDTLQGAMDKAKNIDFDYQKSTTFMDLEIDYPTSLGLAFRLKVQGSMAARVKMDGKLDLPAILRDPADTNVRFQLIPSAAVTVASYITMDGTLVETGAKAIINMHMSNGVDLTVKVLDGRGVDVKLGLPLKKVDLFTVKSEMVSVVKERGRQEVEKKINYNDERQQYAGCFDQLSPVTGLTYCVDMVNAAKLFRPSSVPAKLAAFIEKDDQALTTYHFKVYFNHKKETGENKFEILLDTPNSDFNRKLSLNLEGGLKPQIYLKVVGHSPWGNADFNGQVVNTEKEKTISAKVNWGDSAYSVKAGAMLSGAAGGVKKYKPLLEYKAPAAARSVAIGRQGQGKQEDSYKVTGAVTVETKGPSTVFGLKDLTVHTPRTKYVLEGDMVLGPVLASADVKVSYDNFFVTVKGKYDNTKENALKLSLAVYPDQYKDFAVSAKWNLEHTVGPYTGLTSVLTVIHGPDLKSETTRVTLKNVYSQKIVEKKRVWNDVMIKNSLTYPNLNTEGKLDVTVQPNSLSYDAKAKFEEYQAESKLKAQSNPKAEYDVDLYAKAMQNSLHLQAKREAVEQHKSKLTNSVELVPGGKYQLNAIVLHQIDRADDINFLVDSEIKLPVEPKNIKTLVGLKNTKEEVSGDLVVTAGGKGYVDGKYQVKKGAAPSGTFQLELPRTLKSTGEFSYADRNLKCQVNVKLVKVDRTLEGKADIKAAPPKIAGVIDLCWNVGKPSSSLRIHTDSMIEKNSFDTKNTIDFLEYTTHLNAKGKNSIAGEHMKQSLEGEVILPNGRRTALKASHEGTYKPDHSHDNTDITLELVDVEKQGAEPRKLTVKLEGKDQNWQHLKIDGAVKVEYLPPSKKGFKLATRTQLIPPGGDKWTLVSESTLSGTMLEHPQSGKLKVELSKDYLKGGAKLGADMPPLSGSLSVSTGPALKVEGAAKVTGHSATAELAVTTEPHALVKSFKWTTSNVVDLLPKDGAKRKLKTDNSLEYDEGKFIKVSGEVNEEENGANFKTEWETNEKPKRSINGAAHFKPGGGQGPCKGDASVALAWEGKTADVSVKVESSDSMSGSVHVLGTTPDKTKFDALLKTKLVKERNGVHCDLVLTLKDKKMTAAAKVELLQDQPLIDVVLERPEGKSKLLLKGDKKGPRHWVNEIKLKWTQNGGGSHVSEWELRLTSPEDFLIKANIDSPKLQLSKFQLKINNKGGKTLVVNVINDDKVLVSGSSTYELTQTGDSSTISGKGNLQIREKPYDLTFSATGTKLENGAEGKVSVAAKGDKVYTFDLDSKSTPNEVSIERVYCQDSKCGTARIKAVSKVIGNADYENSVVVNLDLSTLNPKLHDLSLKAGLKRKGLVFDQEIELQWTPTQKISYVAFVHNDKAGVTVACPKRTVAAEVEYSMPKKEKHGGLKVEASVWLDKVKSPWRTHLLLVSDVARRKEGVTFKGEATFSHPALAKALSVKSELELNDVWDKPAVVGHTELDVFRDKSQAILADLKVARSKTDDGISGLYSLGVKSEGCKVNFALEQSYTVTKNRLSVSEKASYVNDAGQTRTASFLLEGDQHKAHLLWKLPEATVMDVTVNMDATEKDLSYKALLTLVGSLYKESLVADLSAPSFTYQVVNSPAVGGKTLVLKGGAQDNKSAYLQLTFAEKSVADLAVNLENFETKFVYDTENLRAVYKTWAEDLTQMQKAGQKLTHATVEKCLEQAKVTVGQLRDALPDLAPLGASYREELEAIKNEITSDETFKEVAAYFKESLSTVIEQVVVVMEGLTHFAEDLLKIAKETLTKLEHILKESMPLLKSTAEKVSKIAVTIVEDALKFGIQLVDILLAELKKHEADIRLFLDTVFQQCFEYGSVVADLLKSVKDQLKDFVVNLAEQIKQMPIIDMIQEKLQEWKSMPVPEDLLAPISEIMSTIKAYAPTPEVGQFIGTLCDYIEKALTRKEIDLQTAVSQLYEELVSAVKSVVIAVTASAPEKLWRPDTLLAVPNLALWTVPIGNVRVNLLRWIQSKDLPSLEEIVRTALPAVNPLDEVPPYPIEALILSGAELITFDSRHVTFKGTCTYLLAEDYRDGNFTLLGTFDDGKLNSITIGDGNDLVEIRHNKNAVVNGKETEFPVWKGQLKAWIDPNTVGVSTKAGAYVICLDDFSVCYVRTSGFFFGKLRGLLGTPNYEPYDDMTLPKGTVNENVVAFSNAWRLDPSCPSCRPAVPSKPRQALCTEFFTAKPGVQTCELALDPKPYREACDSLVGSAGSHQEKLSAACASTTAYVYRCKELGNILAHLPDECLTCKGSGGEKVEHGSKRTVSPSGKAADVLFVVEELKPNDQTYKALVPPLVQAIKAAYKAKGINDIKVGMVGFGHPANRYPDYFTNKGKLGFSGKTDRFRFGEEKENPSVCEKVIDFIEKETGESQRGKVYREVLKEYEFRPEAAKSIVAVHAKGCHKGLLYPFNLPSLRSILGITAFADAGVTINYITPISIKLLEGGDASIVGYSRNKVYTLNSAAHPKLDTHKELVGKIKTASLDDACAGTIKYVDGNVYAGKMFSGLSREEKEKYVEVVARSIVETSVEKQADMECRCDDIYGIVPRNKCRLTPKGNALDTIKSYLG